MFGSSGARRSTSYFFRIGTCVEQTEVSQGDASWGEVGWTGNWVEEGVAWNKKLKVWFWNVCGWSGRDGGQLERRVQKHDMVTISQMFWC